MTKEGERDLRDKIMKGIELAIDQLIKTTQKEDGELVFFRDGRIVKVKAKDLLNK
jgi:hypothetical protein